MNQLCKQKSETGRQYEKKKSVNTKLFEIQGCRQSSWNQEKWHCQIEDILLYVEYARNIDSYVKNKHSLLAILTNPVYSVHN